MVCHENRTDLRPLKGLAKRTTPRLGSNEGGALAHLLRWASIYSVNALLNLPFQPLYYFLELQLFPLIRRERLGSKYTVDLF